MSNPHSVLAMIISTTTIPSAVTVCFTPGGNCTDVIAHHKIMVIDHEIVLTGSFNFTKAAQAKNAENLLTICDATLASQYTRNWEAHRQHCQPDGGRGVRQ